MDGLISFITLSEWVQRSPEARCVNVWVSQEAYTIEGVGRKQRQFFIREVYDGERECVGV